MSQFENVQTIPAHDPAIPQDPEGDAPVKTHPLDTDAGVQKQGKLMAWYTQEREKQAANRYQMALDEDFYDGLQWSEEEIQELAERGQAALVYNKIKPTVDWVLGTEKRTRIDFKVLPREEQDYQGAEDKTKLLKYLSDVNKAPFARSRAFADAIKAGVGWLEDGARGDPEEEILFTRNESWRNIIYDSSAIERDLKDARYIFRIRYVDLDVAQSYFPDRAEILRQAAVSADLFNTEQDDEFWYLGQHFQARDARGEVIGRRTFVSDALFWNRRERVKLIECWYRDPVTEKIINGGDSSLHGKLYNAQDAVHVEAQRQGIVSIYDRVRFQVRCAVLTEDRLLVDSPSPYRHNRFPFTPIWCYRRARDNAPYGLIRNIRDPQEDLNKRASKALFILSTNRIEGEEGAVDDWDQTAEEAARPDGVIIRKKGSELKIHRDTELAEEHLTIMQTDARMIQDVGGVTDENLGHQTNATSGRAILARQDQGSVVTAEPFDNLRFGLQLEGEMQLSLIEQYYTMPKVVRIVGNKGKLDWSKVNQIDPTTGEVLNDITANQADFVIGDEDFRQSMRIAMFETLSDMVAKMPPEVSMNLMDLVVDLSDAPNKEEFVARIRKINGQVDPDAKLTPQQIKDMQDKAQQDQEKAAIAKRAALAKITKDETSSELNAAQAVNLQVDSHAKAAPVAAQLASAPQLAALIETLIAKSVQEAISESLGTSPTPAPPAMLPGGMPPGAGGPAIGPQGMAPVGGPPQ